MQCSHYVLSFLLIVIAHLLAIIKEGSHQKRFIEKSTILRHGVQSTLVLGVQHLDCKFAGRTRTLPVTETNNHVVEATNSFSHLPLDCRERDNCLLHSAYLFGEIFWLRDRQQVIRHWRSRFAMFGVI